VWRSLSRFKHRKKKLTNLENEADHGNLAENEKGKNKNREKESLAGHSQFTGEPFSTSCFIPAG